jgi:chromosome segregation ATPase
MVLTKTSMRKEGWQLQRQHLVLAHTGTQMTGGTAPELVHRQSPLKPIGTRSGRDFDDAGLKIGEVYSNTEHKAAYARIEELEQQVALKGGAARMLDKLTESWVERAANADRRVAVLEGELDSVREELANQENQNCSLQNSLDLIDSENLDLSRRIVEYDRTVHQLHSLLKQADATLTLAKAEHHGLATATDKTNARYQSETCDLQNYLRSVTSRAVAAERALSEARRSLLACTDGTVAIAREIAHFSHRLVESHTAVDIARHERDQIRASLAFVEAERNGLAVTVFEKDKRLEAETGKLKAHLGTMASHATNANELLVEVQQSLLGKFEILERSLRDRERQNQDLEYERSKLIEHVTSLSDTVKVRDRALFRAKRNIKTLVEKAADTTVKLSESCAEIERLKIQLENDSDARKTERDACTVANAEAAPLPDNFGLCGETKYGSSETVAAETITTRFVDVLLANTITF